MSSVEGARRGRQTAPLASIARSEHEGVRVVEVIGELDISNVNALEDATFDLPNEDLGIVLDLRAASYIDSATLGVLFKLQHSLQRRGQALRVVVAAESSAQRVLELTGFDPAITCENDRDAAIAEIRRDVPIHD
jgi:anti-anti-sigma factor